MLDEETRLFYLNGKTISLSELETKLLGYLIEHKKRIVPYQEIAEAFYHQYTSKTKSSIVVLAQRVNQKIGYRLIRAKKQFGYKIKWREK